MKVLVTGGAGFIGSHLADKLVENGKEVVVLDDLSAGKKKNVNKKVDFFKGDICDSKDVNSAVAGVDTVYHLAGLVSVPLSEKYPIKSLAINTGATYILLRASQKNNVKNFVYFSTAAVYGDSKGLVINENSEKKPINLYGYEKLWSENCCSRFSKLNISIVRPFNVYGPRQDPANPYSGVISKFISNAVHGRDLVVFGDGKQTRDFIYVDDVVDAAILVSGRPGVYNVGTGKSVTIKGLADIVLELTKSKSKITYAEKRQGDILYSEADISKVRGLGFEPKYSLRQGLLKMLK